MQDSRKFEQVARRIAPGSTLLRASAPSGGISAQVTALEIERPGGQTQKLVVRRHGAVDLRRNPRIAADEFRLLRILQSAGIAAPAPYYLDESCEIFPTPYLVMQFIEGEPDFAADNVTDLTRQLATQLATIHRVDAARFDLAFLPDQSGMYTRKLNNPPATLDDSLSEGRIRAALARAWPLRPRNAPVLLHGDYWPGNILWEDGQLAAIIDWEDVALGDPLADLANSRLELLWFFGSDALPAFTQHYRSLTTIDFADLPYWDLCAALRPIAKFATMFDEPTAQTMRERHRWFVDRALEAIAGRKA